jgi:hypothetical protein
MLDVWKRLVECPPAAPKKPSEKNARSALGVRYADADNAAE